MKNRVVTTQEIEANSSLCDEEFRNGAQVVRSSPKILTIDTTSVCNLKCVMCSHGLDSPDEKYEHFPDKLAEDLPEVISKASIVQLHGNGEPLMNPAFWKMLAMTNANQHVVINSNGVLLNEKNRNRLLATSIGEISFSLDAATADTYRKIRGADFNEVIGNIRKIIEAKKAQGRGRPRISMNMTLMRENIEEAPLFIELCHNIGADGVQIGHLNSIETEREWRVERDGWVFDYHAQKLSNYPGLSNRMIRQAQARAKELGVTLDIDWAKPVFFDEDISAQNSSTDKTGDARRVHTENMEFSTKDCDTPWNWMFIQTNGNVFPCCFGTGTLGNVADHSPLEIWNGRTARNLRRYITSDRIHPICSRGVCKFVNGRPSPDEKMWWKPENLNASFLKTVEAPYLLTKKAARSIMGEKAWAMMKSVYKSVKKSIAGA